MKNIFYLLLHLTTITLHFEQNLTLYATITIEKTKVVMIMSLDYLINLFAYKIYKEKILSHSDIRKMRYGMTVISHEMIKIILLFISFKLIAYLDLFLFSFFILMSIRTFSGGLHFESSLICFIFSFAFFLLTVVILQIYFL